jgi:hypothetical protein
MAATPSALAQRTPLGATPGSPQIVRPALEPANCTPGRTELQATGAQLFCSETIPLRTLAELQATDGITPDSFTNLQTTGTLNSQSILLRSFPKLFGTGQELFSSSTECPLVILR